MSEKRSTDTVVQKVVMVMEQSKSTCCFCIPMKFACFSFGYLTLVLNMLNTITIVGAMIITGFLEQGINYIQSTGNKTYDYDPEMDSIDKYFVVYLLLLTGAILLLDITWICWNVVMLVGLHKKQPGPIMLHTSAVCIRFTLMILIMLTSFITSFSIFFTYFEICTTGVFVILYHSYATQLKRLQESRSHDVESTIPPITISDAHFMYPKSLDKQHLVDKEKY